MVADRAWAEEELGADLTVAEAGGGAPYDLRTLSGPLEWNATLIEGELDQAIAKLKAEGRGNLIVSGCGELAHTLTRQGLVDEFWFWIHPHIWADGPRIFEGVGPVRLRLVASTAYRSGVLWLRYRPAVTGIDDRS